MVKIMSLITHTHTQPFTLLVALTILTMHANYLKSIKCYSTLLEIIGCEGNSLIRWQLYSPPRFALRLKATTGLTGFILFSNAFFSVRRPLSE